MKKKTRPTECGCSILAFGAHPDDIELAVGGTLIKAARAGRRVVAVELTRGESGTRGTAAGRLRESERAGTVLGLAARENLGLPDAGLELSLEHRHAAAAAIRRHRPEVLFAPWVEDLHPDHAAAGRIVRAAMFDARLAKLAGRDAPWFAGMILYYACRHYYQPAIVVDISREYGTKKKSWQSHRSQMSGKGNKDFRPPGVLDPFVQVEVRDRHHGSLIGVKYGEGFLSPTPLPLADLSKLGVNLDC